MATITERVQIDGKHLVPALQQAAEKLDNAKSEMVLDFSSVHRINASALRGMEQLADAADKKIVKLRLHGINVNIYKVLKLAKSAPRFTFTWDSQLPPGEQECCHAEPKTR